MNQHEPGKLVHVRGRDWIVQPSANPELTVLKPLGGSDAEITAIFRPLGFREDVIEDAVFPMPDLDEIGPISDARLLYEASRLSFRSGAGPFRALGKLAFRPRSYQMVPLIMALRQPVTRLLIADDVGVGKTIEALLIVKELLERREIERFAIICLPHLCDQWQAELEEKFGIQAVIIRSNTQAMLDREIHGDTSVYTYYPYQIISVDYIKSDARRLVFVNECPELVIVDEAHTCSRPQGPGRSTQHLRYDLIRRISQKEGQHLILLTATPHSGKPAQFQSLLGLLEPDFENIDVASASEPERRRLARHFVQRKRADVEQWVGGETTPFPDRDAGEYPYQLSDKYSAFYDKLLDAVTGLVRKPQTQNNSRGQRIRYWAALALLRGVMSSPATGVHMLARKITKFEDYPDLPDTAPADNPVLDGDYAPGSDIEPSDLLEQVDLKSSEVRTLTELRKSLEGLTGAQEDLKLGRAIEICREWLQESPVFQPVIFCRFILTAKYLGEHLAGALKAEFPSLNIQVVTSEDPDDVRRQRIAAMEDSPMRILIATDCLSEGVNLQMLFNSVLHYDLPWNPNRLEQREGRVDRFGQKASVVKAYMLYGSDNPIDGTVLNVLLRKVREIKRATGISMPFPEDSSSIMDTILKAVILKPRKVREGLQLAIDYDADPDIQAKKLEVSHAYDEAAAREKATRSRFAQHSIKAQDIETDLRDSDEAIGTPQAVARFVTGSLTWLGVQWKETRKRFVIEARELPEALQGYLPLSKGRNQIRVSFESPAEEGYHYLGRNHPFVSQLCQVMLSRAFQKADSRTLSRGAVIRTSQVNVLTTLVLFRVRSVIETMNRRTRLIAEEMLPWGYRGLPEENDALSKGEVLGLMDTLRASADFTQQQRESYFRSALTDLSEPNVQIQHNQLARERANALIAAHDRAWQAAGKGHRFQLVEPVLPMDIMGIYILAPYKNDGQ